MLETTFGAIFPTFALIVAGYLLRHLGYLSEMAQKGLPEFAFKVALPALIFRSIALAPVPAVPSYAILGAYFGAALLAWALATVATRAIGQPVTDAPAIAMAGTFSNIAILGVALGFALMGPKSAPLLALIVAFDALILWFAATFHLAVVEPREGKGTSVAQDLWAVIVKLVTNPLVLASILGLVWQRFGLFIPGPIDKVLSLAGAGGLPAALVAVGMVLAGFGFTAQRGPLFLILALKLLIFPTLAYIAARFVFAMPPSETALVTLLAAMPVGVNAYLFAATYKRQEAAVSASITISTPLAALTTAALVAFFGQGLIAP